MLKVISFLALGFVLTFTISAQNSAELMAAARSAMDKNDSVSALANLDKLLAGSPANEAALTMRSRIYMRKGRYAEALADAESLLAKNPRNHEALNIRGVAFRDLKKDRNAALADFTRALVIKPDYYFATLNQGITLSMMGRLTASKEAFDKAAALEPTNPSPHYERGRSLIRYGFYSEAVTALSKAISLDANNSQFFAFRSYAHLRLFLDRNGKIADARADTDKAIQVNSKNHLAYAVRSLVKLNEGSADALADAERAIALDPNNFLAYVTRAIITVNANKPDAAIDDIQKAVALEPQDTWVIQKRDDILSRATGPVAQRLKAEISLARRTAAESELETAKKNVEENPWDFTSYEDLKDAFGVAFRTDLKDSGAEQYWDALINKNPNNICARRFYAEYLARDWRDMVGYLDASLQRYDGRNGTECAARIAFRIGSEYSSRNLNSEADRYFAQAKKLKPDLKYLDANIAANNAEKEKQQRRRADFEANSIRIDQGRIETASSSNTMGKSPAKRCTDANVKAAAREYDRVHSGIDLDVLEHNQALKKYVGAGGYRRLYEGTWRRMQTIEGRIVAKVSVLLRDHGVCLAPELRAHIMSDRDKIMEVDIPGPWEF